MFPILLMHNDYNSSTADHSLEDWIYQHNV